MSPDFTKPLVTAKSSVPFFILLCLHNFNGHVTVVYVAVILVGT
jgi:hypothetical protein